MYLNNEDSVEVKQSSLDSFAVESQVDVIEFEDENVPSSEFSKPPRAIQMPSIQLIEDIKTPKSDFLYHDLSRRYPNPPISSTDENIVLHRASLQDLAGVKILLNWISDGEASIVDLKEIMQNDSEFDTALRQLSEFVEGDVGGQIIQLTDSRILLLPPGCKGIRGVENETFAAEKVK